jgi:glycosyltransferase involved in cell wall biosynthesis
VFASEEDFGIAPVEAPDCGKPVIAFGRGGATERVKPLGESNPTGLFFEDRSARSIVSAFEQDEREPSSFDAKSCRESAERFAVSEFRAKLAMKVGRAASGEFSGSERLT